MGFSRADDKYAAEFVCDTMADALELPTGNAPGSTCLVIETGDVLVLTTEHEWVPLGYNA